MGYCNTVNVEELAVGDDALKRAQLIKVSVEIVAVALTACIYVQMLAGDDFKYALKARLKRLRTMLFGSPPLTEEQVAEEIRQMNIELSRIERYGQ